MWPNRVSTPGPLTYESRALPTALCGSAVTLEIYRQSAYCGLTNVVLDRQETEKHPILELPTSFNINSTPINILIYEGISKSFEPNMERARNLDLFCFIFQRSPLPTPHTCPI